jgi:hypothetical protein
MSKLLLFVRLDALTIKPYFTKKALLLYLLIGLILAVAVSSSGLSGLLIGLGYMFAGYPFAVGEKSNMDALYMTLAVPRRTVVLGRYVFTLALDVAIVFAGVVLQGIVFRALGREINLAALVVLIVGLLELLTLLQLLQLPIYFKLGYTKAKMLASLPLLGLGAIILLFNFLFQNSPVYTQLARVGEWIGQNPVPASLADVLLWLILLAASLYFSLAFYNKRDF